MKTMKNPGILFSYFIISFMVSSCEKSPVASFTCDQTSGNAPLTVQFISTSTGEIYIHKWDFGDGDTSTDTNPIHTFRDPGSYKAALTVEGYSGTDTKSQAIKVSTPPPEARYTCDRSSGVAPLTVKFVSTSTGVINSYSWNFGDGGTSSEPNPSHTFILAGIYQVVLTVTGPGGSHTYNHYVMVFFLELVPDPYGPIYRRK